MGSKVEVEVVNDLPPYHPMDYAVLGNFSLTTRKVKYVSLEDALTIEGETNTPPYYFRKAMEEGEYSKRNAPECHSYPFYSIPGRWGYCFYIDIRRAYLQIAKRFGSDCHIFPGKSIGYGEFTFDDPIFSQYRIIRGMLVSGTSPELRKTIWQDGNYLQSKSPNTLHAPHLRAAIMNTLHAIAYVLKGYCIYWHTDGCIVPSLYLSKVSKVLDTYGFTHAIKHEGNTEVFGTGSYTIGSYTTLTPKTIQPRKDGILQDNPLWYLVKFAKSPNPPMEL
jgi:hypothetical protein